MMIRILKTLLIFAVIPATVMAQDLTTTQSSAERDLLDAIDRLNQQRNTIAEEKIPLARRITEKETSILTLRNEAARIQAANDARTLALEDIRNNLRDWEEENNFLVSLLDEYARKFETSLSTAEYDQYQADLNRFNTLDPSQIGEDRISVQLELIDQGFSRIRRAFNGDVFEGNVVTGDGVLNAGTVARFGPVSYFQNAAGNINGMIILEDSTIPHIFTEDSGLSNVGNLLTGEAVDIPVDVTGGKALSIESESDGLLEHIGKGGIWIIPILLFAGLSIAASILKIIEIYKIKLPQRGSVHSVLSKLTAGDKSAAQAAAADIPYPVGEMISQAVRHADGSKELIEEIMYESMLDTQPKLEKYLPLIAISAATAPLLGLLGTVTGMINTFELITLFGTGDAQSLSSGISEALITTEFGLIVAIPALIMHALLSRKVQAIMANMEKFAVVFVNGLPKSEGG